MTGLFRVPPYLTFENYVMPTLLDMKEASSVATQQSSTFCMQFDEMTSSYFEILISYPRGDGYFINSGQEGLPVKSHLFQKHPNH